MNKKIDFNISLGRIDKNTEVQIRRISPANQIIDNNYKVTPQSSNRINKLLLLDSENYFVVATMVSPNFLGVYYDIKEPA